MYCHVKSVTLYFVLAKPVYTLTHFYKIVLKCVFQFVFASAKWPLTVTRVTLLCQKMFQIAHVTHLTTLVHGVLKRIAQSLEGSLIKQNKTLSYIIHNLLFYFRQQPSNLGNDFSFLPRSLAAFYDILLQELRSDQAYLGNCKQSMK